MQEIMIHANKITKCYRTKGEDVNAIKEISFKVSKGEFVSIMGQSGSGKSTMLSCIGALNPPTKGLVLIDDIDIYSLKQERIADFRREYLGFVFQQFQLIPYLNARENVLLTLTSTKLTKKEKLSMADQALNRVGLLNKAKRLPTELSGGEQERVAIARAIVNSPPLILADEPTGSLDTNTGEEIMNLFKDLNDDGLTIIMVTHNPENSKYSNRTIELKDGLIYRDQYTTKEVSDL